MNSLDLPVIAFFHLDNTIHLLFGACCFLKPAIYTCVFRIVVHFSELTLVHQPTNVISCKTQHNAENASVNEPLLQSNWKGKLHCSFVFNVFRVFFYTFRVIFLSGEKKREKNAFARCVEELAFYVFYNI